MNEFEVYTHRDVLEVLPKARADRRKILQYLDLLSRSPYTPGDFKEKDATLREREVKVIGKYALSYWVDVPVKIVMVVSLVPADTP